MAVIVNIEKFNKSVNQLFEKYTNVISNYKNAKLVSKDQIYVWINEINCENQKLIKKYIKQKSADFSQSSQSISNSNIDNANEDLIINTNETTDQEIEENMDSNSVAEEPEILSIDQRLQRIETFLSIQKNTSEIRTDFQQNRRNPKNNSNYRSNQWNRNHYYQKNKFDYNYRNNGNNRDNNSFNVNRLDRNRSQNIITEDITIIINRSQYLIPIILMDFLFYTTINICLN
jgi:hypothetical protein